MLGAPDTGAPGPVRGAQGRAPRQPRAAAASSAGFEPPPPRHVASRRPGAAAPRTRRPRLASATARAVTRSKARMTLGPLLGAGVDGARVADAARAIALEMNAHFRGAAVDERHGAGRQRDRQRQAGEPGARRRCPPTSRARRDLGDLERDQRIREVVGRGSPRDRGASWARAESPRQTPAASAAGPAPRRRQRVPSGEIRQMPCPCRRRSFVLRAPRALPRDERLVALAHQGQPLGGITVESSVKLFLE